MTAEEFLNEKEGWVSSRESEAYAIRRHDIELLKQFAQLKCKEQRALCADYADYIIINRTQVVVNRDKILNSPEPEM